VKSRKTVYSRFVTVTGTAAISVLATSMSVALAQEPVEEVLVTGTRIQRNGMSTPTPVTSVSADELAVLAPGQLVEAVAAMPQFLDNHLPADGGAFNTNAGQSFLNLRGIGSSRMLVLLDGRRVVSAGQQGAVNINVFPEAAIERVEVVTGGASAAYGSDAVAGVTNFILNTDYVGFDANVQTGRTSRNDGDTTEISLLGGLELGDRSHLLIAGDHYETDGVFGWDKRSWYRDYAELDNPAGPPDQITVPNARTTLYTYGGLIPSGPLARTQFLPDGTPAPFEAGELVDPPFAQSGGDGVNPYRDNELYPTQERSSVFLHFNRDLTDNVNGYFQATYGNSEAEYKVSELRLYSPFGTQATIYRDNAYLHEDIQAAMDDAGIESFSFHRMSSFADWTDIEHTENTTRSFTVGIDAELNQWTLGAYTQYGRNKRFLAGYQARLDRIYQALDAVIDPATDEIVCNSTLTNPNDGCVPLNLFGYGQMTQQAREYVLDTTTGFTNTRQNFTEISADRDWLPDRQAGPIAFAVGASYRRDTLDAQWLPPASTTTMPTLDEVSYRGLPARQAGSPFIFQQANILAAAGGYDVSEAFSEALIPLVNRPDGRTVNLNVAARYADYDGSGGIWAWKTGIDWEITESVRLRATQSRDIRAANLGERFDRTITDPSYDDPFVGEEHTPIERTISGGNPNVAPEKSDTTTIGVVIQPQSVSGLSLSFDWFDVSIEDAIDQVGGQLIIDLCYEEGSYCFLLSQDPNTGRVLRVDNIFINLVEARVSGVDFEIGYNRQLSGGGSLSMRYFGAYLGEHSFTDQFGVKVDSAGQTGNSSLPEWQGVLSAVYRKGPFALQLTERYIGSGARDNREIEGIDIDDNSVDGVFYTNLRFSYELASLGEGTEFFATAENLFDEDPPLAPGNFSFFSGASQTNAALFDRLGRRYTVGMRLRF
jgi:iron complex outermembrane receptor protein